MCPPLKISEEFFFFFCDHWIELVELHKKKHVSNFKNIFDESQNFGCIPLIFENNGILDVFPKIFFFNLKHTFSYATRRALSNDHKKRKKNSSEIFSSGHIAYSVNTLKTEYLGPGTPSAANIFQIR